MNPALYAKNIDIPDFAYSLYLQRDSAQWEIARGLERLARWGNADLIALYAPSGIVWGDARSLYQRTGDLYHLLTNTSGEETRALLFQRKVSAPVFSDVLMLHGDEARRQAEAHPLCPAGVSLWKKDGSQAALSLNQWETMGLRDRLSLSCWVYQYDPAEARAVLQAHQTFFEDEARRAKERSPLALLQDLNAGFMGRAAYPEPGFFRVPRMTAEQLLLNGRAPVYGLLPGGPVKLRPDALRMPETFRAFYRDFAIRGKDLPALEAHCRKETDKMTRRKPERPCCRETSLQQER